MVGSGLENSQSARKAQLSVRMVHSIVMTSHNQWFIQPELMKWRRGSEEPPFWSQSVSGQKPNSTNIWEKKSNIHKLTHSATTCVDLIFYRGWKRSDTDRNMGGCVCVLLVAVFYVLLFMRPVVCLTSSMWRVRDSSWNTHTHTHPLRIQRWKC